jgi:putative oxidoreductase
MEAVMLGSISVSPSVPIRPSRIGLIALWGLQVALAALFLLAGGAKLAGAPPMVAVFEAIGVGQWFRYVTGLVEVASAVALLVPELAPFGALLLVPTMVGAIATHLLIIGGSPARPAPLLLGSLAVAWARRDRLRPFGRACAKWVTRNDGLRQTRTAV